VRVEGERESELTRQHNERFNYVTVFSLAGISDRRSKAIMSHKRQKTSDRHLHHHHQHISLHHVQQRHDPLLCPHAPPHRCHAAPSRWWTCRGLQPAHRIPLWREGTLPRRIKKENQPKEQTFIGNTLRIGHGHGLEWRRIRPSSSSRKHATRTNRNRDGMSRMNRACP